MADSRIRAGAVLKRLLVGRSKPTDHLAKSRVPRSPLLDEVGRFSPLFVKRELLFEPRVILSSVPYRWE